METGVAEQSLTAEDQLFILTQATLYLTATRGPAAPEMRICYELAEPLCHSLNRPLLLYVALVGHFRFSLHTEKLTATMRIAERVCALAEEQNNPALKIGAYHISAATLYHLGDFQAARKYARSGIQIWRSGAVPSPVEDFETAAVCCLCYDGPFDWRLAFSPWHTGRSTRQNQFFQTADQSRTCFGEDFFVQRRVAGISCRSDSDTCGLDADSSGASRRVWLYFLQPARPFEPQP